MSVLVFYSNGDPLEKWRPELARELPDVEVRDYADPGDRSEVDYALVWYPPEGFFEEFPNLKLVHSIGAGVDHVVNRPDLPRNVPIVRMVDDYLRDQMSEYAIMGVLWFHRHMHLYEANRPAGDWLQHWPHYTPDMTVGVLGIGSIGEDVARKLAALNFNVLGWSRSEKSLDGITCYHGEKGLRDMLPQTNYLVCVLPLTEETRGIINKDLMAQLPEGASIINLARGGHLVDEDLLAMIDSGHIAGAFLDVFNEEPLPAEHPYWGHPRIMMTPHVAGVLVPRSCARQVAKNLKLFEAGKAIPDQLDLEKGY